MVEIPDAQFLMMSATFGDTSKFVKPERKRRRADVAVVGGNRPCR